MFKTGCRVCDAMTRKPIAVSPDTTVMECAQLMKDNLVGSLVVIDGYSLKGYLTEDAIIQKIVANDLRASRVMVKDIMASNVVTVEPEKDIYDALMLMKEHNVRQLPVIDRGRLVGLLTIKDILKIEPQLFELITERIMLREEGEKLPMLANLEGQCDSCGSYSVRLYEANDVFLCRGCQAASLKLNK